MMETQFGRDIVALQADLARTAGFLTSSVTESADLVQETNLKALRNRTRFQAGTNLRAWLNRMMRNIFIDRYRRRRREHISTDGMELLMDTPGRDSVREALDTLDPNARAMVVLRDVEGRSYREIAEILGRPQGTIMSGLHRARKRLREVITRQASGSVSASA